MRFFSAVSPAGAVLRFAVKRLPIVLAEPPPGAGVSRAAV